MSIPFEIPSQYLAPFYLGQIERYGTLLKDAHTGKIVAHLQETGALHSLAQGVLGANPVSAVVNTASNVAANAQLWRLDTKITALQGMVQGLQAMQGLTLALSGIGVGISVIGFAQMKSRLTQVEQKIDALTDEVRNGFDEARRNRLQDNGSALSGILDNAEEGWHARDGGLRAWQGVAADLGSHEHFYTGEIDKTINAGATPDVLAYLVERYRVCVATKLECLVLLNEFDQASKYAQSVSERTERLFGDVTPLTLDGSFAEGTPKLSDPHERMEAARVTVLALRELEDQHATRDAMISVLARREISGRDYVTSLRDESEHPLLLLTEE